MSPLAWYLSILFYQVGSSRPDVERAPMAKQLAENIMACEEKWFSFGEKCYKIGGRKQSLLYTWEKAEDYCSTQGGNLITIDSEDIQEFVTIFLLMQVKYTFWIGLNDKNNETVYEWVDGTAVNYTNWSEWEPSGLKYPQEDCIEMYYKPVAGLKKHFAKWNDASCEQERAFVCQKDPISFSLVKAPLDPRYCSEENNSGVKFLNSCFNFVPTKMTWYEAEKYCKGHFSGHLTAIRDSTYELFLDFFLKDYPQHVWIGIAIKESFTQKWSSGWFVGYNGWRKDKRDFVNGTCVEYKKDWKIVPCTRKNAFVCESTTDIVPVLSPPSENSVCPNDPDGWLDLGGDRCYFIEIDKNVNWYEANFECMQRNGNLLSVHKKEELDVLEEFLALTWKEVHIGLHQLQEEKKYIWSDKSDVNFLNWEVGEPNRDDEVCAMMQSWTMKWHNIVCPRAMGYICSVKKIPVPINATAESLPETKPSAASYGSHILPGVSIGTFCIGVILGIIIAYYFISYTKQSKKRKTVSVSYIDKNQMTERDHCRQSFIYEGGREYETMD